MTRRRDLKRWQKALMTFEHLPHGEELDFYDKWWWEIEWELRK